MSKRLFSISFLAATLLLAACGGDNASKYDLAPDEEVSVSSAKITTDLRVTQIAAHHDVEQIVGFATGNQVMYLVTPDEEAVEAFDWSDAGEGGTPATRSQHAFDAHGEHFMVLDTQGTLHILETGATSADWSYKAGVAAVSATSVTAGAKLAVSQAGDQAYITDPENHQVQVIDLEAGALGTPITLPFTPAAAGLAWTGLAAEHAHDEEEEEEGHGAHPGRLVIVGTDDKVYVVDLEAGELLNEGEGFALATAATAIHASPGHRYALIGQAEQVQILDSGLEPHDDHVDEHAPALLAFKLLGQTPAHYRSVDGVAALFFDAGSTRFALFTDASLEGSGVLATQNSIAAHHGIAEPRGEFVLVSKPDRTGVSLYELHGDHFHFEGDINGTCNLLHGGGSNHAWSAFGCEDGVLLVSVSGEGHDHDH